MNILKKKLKKVNKIKKVIYFFTLLLYLTTYIYFMIGLLNLKGIETIIRIIVLLFFGIWFVVYLLSGLLSLISKKMPTFIILTIISLLCTPVFFFGSNIIIKNVGFLNQTQRDKIEYSSNLIALKETNFTSSSLIGMIETESDISGNQLAHKLIKKNNLTNKINTYEDYTTMIRDLYAGKIDACFVSGDFAVIFKNESFEDVSEDQEQSVPRIEERVKVLYEYSEIMQNQDVQTLEESKTKQITEPFTVLIMGVDSEKDGLTANQAFNGDTLIMVTFNPDTLTATMFSIPRDLYVPISCNHNRYNKINSSAAYGSSCVIGTVEQLTGIKIDFYVKINFKGVVDLVNVLGGVTVDVEEPDFNWNAGINCNSRFCEQNSNREFGDQMIYLDPGVQTLDGEQALAYARCRHLYALSDIARNQHQQAIIEAMIQKLKTLRSLGDFEKVLQTVSKNIETNMTTEQILSFYNVGKNMLFNSKEDEKVALSIKKTYLSFYNLTVWRGYNASCLGYHQNSLDAITKLMRVNLGLEKETPIKTFSISYNEDYKTPLVGQGIYGGEKLETLPSLIGNSKQYVSEYCSNHNINCTFESTDGSSTGTVIDQSVHENTLLKALNETIVFKTANNQSIINNNTNNTTEDKKEEETSEDKTNDDKKEEINTTTEEKKEETNTTTEEKKEETKTENNENTNNTESSDE